MITMHARPKQTDGQTDEHHGNNATIPSTNASRAKSNDKTKNVKNVKRKDVFHIYGVTNMSPCDNLSPAYEI